MDAAVINKTANPKAHEMLIAKSAVLAIFPSVAVATSFVPNA